MNDIVWGEGPIPSVGMIIGEAPGAEEEKAGRPFVGRSGQLLNEALEEAGLRRDSIYITNCYKLRPPNNRTPTDEELNSHMIYIDKEFLAVRPKFVLLLGNCAIREFYGDEFTGVTNMRGKWAEAKDESQQLICYLPTFHSSYVLRGKGKDEFFSDVHKFATLVKAYS